MYKEGRRNTLNLIPTYNKAGSMQATASAITIFGKMIQHGRWWHALLIILTVTVLGVALRWFVHTQLLKKWHAQLQAAGQPFTSEELGEYYSIPEGSVDTTDLWLEALRLVTEHESYEEEKGLPIVSYENSPDLPRFGDPWPEAGAVAIFLEGQAVPLAAIHRAANADGAVRFSHDFGPNGDAVGELLEIAMALRRCERLLLLQAYTRAREGDKSGSVESLSEIFAVGKTLEGYPLALALLVRTAISGSATNRCGSILPFVDASEDDLKSIQVVLRGLDYRRDLYRAIVGERVFCLHNCTFELPNTTDIPIPEETLWYFEPGIQLRILDYQDGIAELAHAQWPEALSTVAKFDDWRPNQWSLTDPVAGQSVCMTSSLFSRAASSEANAAALDAAIATELFRREKQYLPTTLTELVPDYLPSVPGDPFTGEPLRYITTEDEVLIYSVGEDSVDNQGHVNYEDEEEPRDVGVRWALKRATQTSAPATESPENREPGEEPPEIEGGSDER